MIQYGTNFSYYYLFQVRYTSMTVPMLPNTSTAT